MIEFRLANPCQNRESKQKHDKRDKRNANECLFNTDVADPVKPLNSYSVQIKFDITI